MPSSSVHGDKEQQCWAWNYTKASLLRVASQSKPASHLPQFMTGQEQVLVVYARNTPRGRSDPAGTRRSWILQVRQAIEPSILQCQGCIASTLFFAGILPSCVPALEVKKGHSVASPNLLLLTLKWDLSIVCFTMLGVTLHIFHRSSFLCSQGSFSTRKTKS